MTRPLRISAQELASGELDGAALHFVEVGLAARQSGRGMLEIRAAFSGTRRRVLLSVGIHGDETAPIELLAEILSSILDKPLHLQADLLVIVGNPDAVAQEKRYVDVDLNRLFHGNVVMDKESREKTRALAIMRTVGDFFSVAGEKMHLDLHTAIRASRYPSFAVVPAALAEQDRQSMAAWLGGAGIDAVVMNNQPARTFSAYTAHRFGSLSATVELGRIGRLGENDLSGFSSMKDALKALLISRQAPVSESGNPRIFEVAREIVKHSTAFRMALDAAVENFTPLHRGMEIAHDGERIYRVEAETEYILFPNPDVAVGQRAGLMLIAH